MKTVLLTVMSLIAFAGNSIFCRMALGANNIDAASFTSIRLFSGAIALFIVHKICNPHSGGVSRGTWKASLMLFVYAATFSYGYITLDAGTGALILFASVQITMLLANVLSGGKVYFIEWVGVVTAFVGFVYLVFPVLSTPSLGGLVLMTVSGIAWGVYTLAGNRCFNPLSETLYNFIRTFPFLIVLTILTVDATSLTQKGVVLAVLSGALTSGVGYAIWYAALGKLSAVQAGVVQLLVPVIAAAGGSLFIDEIISVRLVLSSIIILGGILVVILGRRYFIKA